MTQAAQLIESYVYRHYGNLIIHTNPVFDTHTKTWTSELKSDYPRLIKDDSNPDAKLMKFLTLRHLGEVSLNKASEIKATPRDQCILRINTLLARWRHYAENVIASASSMELATIGTVKDVLNPIVMITANYLRKGVETIKYSEIDREIRAQRMRQYFKFLSQIQLLEETDEGYRYAPLFVELRKNLRSDEEFKTKIIAYVMKEHYSTLRQVFRISRFEPLVHMETCYYAPSLEAERLLSRREESLIALYYKWYGRSSNMRLRSILDDLVAHHLLEKSGEYYRGAERIWKELGETRNQIPQELSPIRG